MLQFFCIMNLLFNRDRWTAICKLVFWAKCSLVKNSCSAACVTIILPNETTILSLPAAFLCFWFHSEDCPFCLPGRESARGVWLLPVWRDWRRSLLPKSFVESPNCPTILAEIPKSWPKTRLCSSTFDRRACLYKFGGPQDKCGID